jgi:hypothetical protein
MASIANKLFVLLSLQVQFLDSSAPVVEIDSMNSLHSAKPAAFTS